MNHVATSNAAPLPHRYGEERYRQLRRILTTGEVLRSFRFGVTVVFLNREVNERTGETWNYRTTQRDVGFLESCGMVESIGIDSHGSHKWRWCEAKPLGESRPERIPAPSHCDIVVS